MCWSVSSSFVLMCELVFFFFKQKTAYEMRISDWSSDVCSSDLSAAALAFGASLRGWRIDTYRTRQAEKAKPTLKQITLVSSDAGAAWERRSAVAAGVAFTRELVSEPANILYPESFVERCRHLEQLGVKLTVLDKAEIGRAHV